MLVLCVRSLNNFDLPFWGGNEHVFNILITFVKMQNILQFSAKDFASLQYWQNPSISKIWAGNQIPYLSGWCLCLL